MQSCIEVLSDLPGFVGQLDLHKRSNDLNIAERLFARGEDYIALLNVVRRRLEHCSEFSDIVDDLWSLLEVVQFKLAPYAELIHTSQRFSSARNQLVGSLAPTVDGAAVLQGNLHHRGPGRPKIFVSRDQIESLFELGFTYAKVAKLLSMSERTLQRRRVELGLPVGRALLYSPLSERELDDTVASILQVRYINVIIVHMRS